MEPSASTSFPGVIWFEVSHRVQSVPSGAFSIVRVCTARPVSGSVSPSVQTTLGLFAQLTVKRRPKIRQNICKRNGFPFISGQYLISAVAKITFCPEIHIAFCVFKHLICETKTAP
jgi:hypothetical protein